MFSTNKIELLFSAIMSICYNALGTYELLFDGDLTQKADSLFDGLDLYLILPAHVFGSYLWYISGSLAGAWIGQIFGSLVWLWLIFGIIQWIIYFNDT